MKVKSQKSKVKSYGNGFAVEKLLMIVAIGIVLGAGIYAAYRYVKNNLKVATGPETNVEKPDWIKTAKEARETMATVVPAQKPDFIKEGYLQLRGEGTETENWILLYEEPGRLALTVSLNFNNRSRCDFGSGEQICNTKKFENGLRVYLEGTKNGSEVTVIKLKETESPQ